MPEEILADLMKRFVRGEVSFEELRESGIRVEFRQTPSGRSCRVVAPRPFVVTPSSVDIARGLVDLSGSEHLRDWASVLLMDLDHVKLDAISDGGPGGFLLDAIWDAAFEGHVSEASLARAGTLVER